MVQQFNSSTENVSQFNYQFYCFTDPQIYRLLVQQFTGSMVQQFVSSKFNLFPSISHQSPGSKINCSNVLNSIIHLLFTPLTDQVLFTVLRWRAALDLTELSRDILTVVEPHVQRDFKDRLIRFEQLLRKPFDP